MKTFSALLCLVLFPVTLSAAQPNNLLQAPPLITLDDVGRGQLLFRTLEHGRYLPAPLVATETKITIGGILATTTVKQYFINPTNHWLEGRYVFPLPENSAVDRIILRLGNRKIEGKIAERRAARKAYNKAKAEGRRAALVEQHRPNIFSNNVANIAPGGRIAIELRYFQRLRYDRGKFSLRFPLVVAPRFSPSRNKSGLVKLRPSQLEIGSPNAPIVVPVRDTTKASALNPVTLTVSLDAGVALKQVESSSHKLAVEKTGTGKRQIALADKAVSADRDFVLSWTPVTSDLPRSVGFRETIGEYTYALAMILPPDTRANTLPPPRDVVFILDRSGSMGGVSIRAARHALDAAIGRLTDRDRFNVIRFSDRTDSLFSNENWATGINRLLARMYVRGTEADGGTMIKPALEQALPVPLPKMPQNRLRQVVFVTDGMVSNETELLADIRRRLGQSRLFTVGIGSAPNSYFMRKAAEVGRGTFVYVSDLKQVSLKMASLLKKLERPALTGISAAWDKGGDARFLVESYPDPVPDLYAGEPVVLVSRIPATGVDSSVHLTAQGWKAELRMRDVRVAVGISKLWARAKIGALMDARFEGTPEGAVRSAVTRIALAHGLVSKYTSLLATEKTVSRPADKPVASTTVPLNLSYGWDLKSGAGEKLLRRTLAPAPKQTAAASGVSGFTLVDAPQGSTPFFIHLAAGLGLLTLALLILVAVRPSHRRNT